jgi:acyl transferase domain-containing protein
MPQRFELVTEREKLLSAAGMLWLAKIPLDWETFHSGQRCLRIPLPTYPFERQRYWAGAMESGDYLSASYDRPPDDERRSPAPSTASVEACAEPENDLQAVVAAIWADSLGLERISIHDGFFEIGGNSVLATRIVKTIRETLQVDLPLRALFDSPTVASLSKEIEAAAREMDTDVHETARLVREIVSLPEDQIAKRLAGSQT